MILYMTDLKYSTRKFLDLIDTFGKVVGHKINAQNSVSLPICWNILKYAENMLNILNIIRQIY